MGARSGWRASQARAAPSVSHCPPQAEAARTPVEEPLMDDAPVTESYEFIADLYDHVEIYSSRPDVEFYVEEALRSGGPVLELGCGTGRVLVPTARAGVEITGLDLSTKMLDVCRERLAAEPPEVRARVRIVQGDLAAFDLECCFALVTVPFRPFQHLTRVEEQLSCLAAVRRHLSPGGRLVFDVFNPSIPMLSASLADAPVQDGPPFTMPDGRVVVRSMHVVSKD